MYARSRDQDVSNIPCHLSVNALRRYSQRPPDLAHHGNYTSVRKLWTLEADENMIICYCAKCINVTTLHKMRCLFHCYFCC